jgi:sugar diacid utilization regulator
VRPDLTLVELEGAGQRLEESAGALLWTVRHQSVVAAVEWEPGLRRRTLARRLEHVVDGDVVVAIGLGGSAEGIAETRDSYAEAIAALRLGPIAHPSGDVVFDFHDVAALAAILEHPDRARRFATSVLEPLAGVAARPWALPTLEAYLLRQGRIKQAAADLGVHLNTVKYRLRELRPVLDGLTRDGTGAATVLLALQAARAAEADAPGRTRRTDDAPASGTRSPAAGAGGGAGGT